MGIFDPSTWPLLLKIDYRAQTEVFRIYPLKHYVEQNCYGVKVFSIMRSVVIHFAFSFYLFSLVGVIALFWHFLGTFELLFFKQIFYDINLPIGTKFGMNVPYDWSCNFLSFENMATITTLTTVVFTYISKLLSFSMMRSISG